MIYLKQTTNCDKEEVRHLSCGFLPWGMGRKGTEKVGVQAVVCCILGDCCFIFWVFFALHFLLPYHPSPHGDITAAMPLLLEWIPHKDWFQLLQDPSPVSFHLQGVTPVYSTFVFHFYLPTPCLCSDSLWPHVEQTVCPYLLLYSMGCEPVWCQQWLEISLSCGLAFLGFCHHHKRNMPQLAFWS